MEQTLGKRIAEHRKRLSLTQDALAEKLGITAQAVSKWENDLSCPDINMLPKLAEIFGITTDELLGREVPVHTAEVVSEDDADSGVFNFSSNSNEEGGKWVFHWDSGRKNALCSAICVLLVGVVYLLAKWFDWDVSFWGILWPSVLLVYGLAGIFPKFSLFNFGIALGGGYFLINNIGLWELDIAGKLIFPICIVLFGLSLLMDALRKPKHGKFRIKRHGSNCSKTKCNCQTTGDRFDCDLAFGENIHRVAVPMLSGGEASLSFGQLIIDLTGCEKVSESCHIEADCAFGELCIRVPKRFAVQSSNSTAFATVNVTGQPDSAPQGVIHLDADASFGEICIEYV